MRPEHAANQRYPTLNPISVRLPCALERLWLYEGARRSVKHHQVVVVLPSLFGGAGVMGRNTRESAVFGFFNLF